MVKNAESGTWVPPRPKIVCLCGSVRFREDFEKWACFFTREGVCVVGVACYDHDHFHNTEQGALIKMRLDYLHFQKIAMADAVFVINKDGYIGESTAREIRMAEALGILVAYMDKPQHDIDAETDLILAIQKDLGEEENTDFEIVAVADGNSSMDVFE
jgi:hypothetical protein